MSPMRRKRELSFDGLEERCVMSTVTLPTTQVLVAPKVASISARQVVPGFGGGFVDRSIPFVFGFNVGAPQFAVNFTSNTYQIVLFGTDGRVGIKQAAARFANTGNVSR